MLYQDAHVLVADKPHFLPVLPTGPYLQNTLLVRLKRRLGLRELSPVHRIDRETAGLVLFSTQRATRGVYQDLFRQRMVVKEYEAIAPWHPELAGRLPGERRSRLEQDERYFRMSEVPGQANSVTHIEVLQVQGDWARYRLRPVTGKRHQLRVHMAALGLALRGDSLYPSYRALAAGDYGQPLQLLAKRLEFTDPLTGVQHQFCSQQALQALDSLPTSGVGMGASTP